jgi:hypothetical protein
MRLKRLALLEQQVKAMVEVVTTTLAVVLVAVAQVRERRL